ncbi:choline dehydrogenase [Trichophyton tonsurans CBS 112818]|uniref:glucose oxidase n=1 Tax=Trichophyton tonsurans (strain CBS 112818) TaxID=647933 RepID=F2RVB3_TRIT1|nr:choline dehydrogenase [Trichophyton tonsurans CBS 112818]
MASPVTHIAPADADSYDYVIVGGGTAGCVIASRLAEYLPRKKILLIEAGPSDYMDDRVLKLKDWLGLLGGEFDYDYGTTEQPMGNSHIRHSRAKVLGGCSSHNTLISFRPFEYDCKVWESKGCKGWSFDTFHSQAPNWTLCPKRETILCAGAIDTPRLLLLSGIGPREQLSALSIPVVKDVPGVGENLVDHPESIIMWELNQPVPPNQTTMDSDAGVFLRRKPINAAGFDGDCADIMMHCYQIPFGIHTGRLGYDVPANAFCVTPNIPRPRSRGRLYLTSADPTVKPALDFRYFTDPEGYDAATIVAGLKAARKIAEEEPFKKWIKREVAPGPATTTDEELSAYGRSVHHTVYHPAGTTKMGDIQKDRMAVVDPTLKIRGLKNVRIADAGVFPDMPSINPMLTVLGVGERAAELIAEEAGWRPSSSRL